MDDSKVLMVVTGCDSGIGLSLCRLLSTRGYAVAASFLHQEPAVEKKNTPFFSHPLDLRNEESINNFAGFIKGLSGQGFQLGTLIQNAGMVLSAPVENMPLPMLREVFEVNYFGVYSLTQKLIPLLIRDLGRIFIVGSMAGRIALPYFSPYVSSKYAIEGFTDTLRREMMQFGVKVVLFEPAAVATPIWSSSWNSIQKNILSLVDRKYKDTFESGAEKFVSGGNRGLPSDEAAARIARVLGKNRPKSRYIISKNNLVEKLELMIPVKWMDQLTAMLFGIRKPERHEKS